MTDTIEVRIKTKAGTIHRGFKVNGVLYVPEADNLDSAEHREIVTRSEAIGWEYEGHLCERCFPLVEVRE